MVSVGTTLLSIVDANITVIARAHFPPRTVFAPTVDKRGIMAEELWHEICTLDDLEVNWGEAALIGEHQYAIFRTPDDRVFATDHKDPNSGALVIARGITGEKGGEPTVTSPLYKEVYSLETGACVSGAEYTLPVYPVKVEDGRVFMSTRTKSA